MTNGISYRLGLLNGQLKGYEDDESLMRIGKEILEKEVKTSNKKKKISLLELF